MSSPAFNTIADVRRFLNETTDYEKMVRWRMKRGAFDLGRVVRFLDALGAPQTAYECAHVAGTSGKGSVTILLDELLRAHGVATGRYTSPHLERETERIAVNGREITEAELTAAFRDMAPVLARFQPTGDQLTFFEIMTAAALLAYRTAGMRAAVLETGLGGRLDATNVVTPLVSVIASIGYDHMDKLGETLADIAYEKSRIIKPGVPLVLGHCDKEAADVILSYAREQSVPVSRLDGNINARNIQQRDSGISFDLFGPHYAYRQLVMNVAGAVQATNAAMAVEALHWMQRAGAIESVSEDAVRQALGRARFPARCEMFTHTAGGVSVPVMLDAGHNAPSMRQTMRTFVSRFGGRRKVLVMALASDKDAEGVVREMTGGADAVFVTRFDSPRAADVETLAAVWRKYSGAEIRVEPDPAAALRDALDEAAHAGGAVLVTGSFYLAGALRSQLAMAAEKEP